MSVCPARRLHPPACAAVLLSALSVGACATTSARSHSASGPSALAAPRASSSSPPAASALDRDGDVDMLTVGPRDTDNDALALFGRPAGAADTSAITALVRRYYAVAAAGEGARACAMLDLPTAEALVEGYRSGHGPSSPRRGACARVMSRLFDRRHRELAEDVRGYRVLVVRVRRNRGYVLVRFPATRELRELQLFVRRERGVWLMSVPLDNGAP